MLITTIFILRFCYSEGVQQTRSGLKKENRPYGRFSFLGLGEFSPTSVIRPFWSRITLLALLRIGLEILSLRLFSSGANRFFIAVSKKFLRLPIKMMPAMANSYRAKFFPM
jgi:hypothetical protein